MLRRVDAENRLQTLKEELDFQKNIYSEVGTVSCRPRGPGWVVLAIRVGAGGPPCAELTCWTPCPRGWGAGDGQHPVPRLKWG